MKNEHHTHVPNVCWLLANEQNGERTFNERSSDVHATVCLTCAHERHTNGGLKFISQLQNGLIPLSLINTLI